MENFLPTVCLFCRLWGGCLERSVTESPGIWLKKTGLAVFRNQSFNVQRCGVGGRESALKQTCGVVTEEK